MSARGRLHGAIDVVVTEVVELNSLIKRFHFARPDGKPLPAFSGGAHIIIQMQDGDTLRGSPYSLSSSPLDTRDYQVSIRRDDQGRGGSLYLHREVKPGMKMSITHPSNMFALDKRASRHLMLAGGIGITPFMSQTAQLAQMPGVHAELHYGMRSRELGVYLEELASRLGSRFHVYADEDNEQIDYDRLLSSQPAGTHLYVCGPSPMIDLVLRKSAEHGWPDNHVHYEHFAKASSGEPFNVELRASGKTIEVGAEQSMLEAIEAAGVDAPYLCRGGACGQCETRVLSVDGELLHEDHWLEDDEKASGEKIMPCVSRCRGTVVLDR